MVKVTIKVSTKDVTDPMKLLVSSTFTHEIPDNLEEAQRCFPATLQEGKLVDPVYELFKSAYIITTQAPSRKELATQWERIPADERKDYITAPKKEDGQFIGTLPDSQRMALQAYMDTWKLGDQATRTRVVKSGGDPVKNLIDGLTNGTIVLTDERKAEIAAQIQALLGGPAPALAHAGANRRR